MHVPSVVPSPGASQAVDLNSAGCVSVSIRMVRAVLELCERKGFDGDALLRGLFNRDQLRRDDRVAWNPYVDFLDRVQQAWGGPEGMTQLGYQLINGSPAMTLLAGLFVSPRRLFLSGSELMARRSYSNLGLRMSELPDGRLAIECTLYERRGSLAFHYASLGCYRAYPRLLGHGDAQVSAQISSHHSRFLITLPRASRLAERAGRAFRSPAAATLAPETSLDDIQLAFDDSGILRDATDIGQSLAAAQSLEALAQSTFELLSRHFLCRSATLWVLRPEDGCEVCVASTGDAHARVCRRPLVLAGREVGHLELDAPEYATQSPTPLLDALLPWVAIGVDRCAKPKPETAAVPSAERAARTWALSRRQTQVLELVMRGCQNKEVASALGCSPRTVEVHVSEIMRRAGVTNRSELVFEAMSS